MGLQVPFRPHFIVMIYFYGETGLAENPLLLVSFSSLQYTALALGMQVAYLEMYMFKFRLRVFEVAWVLEIFSNKTHIFSLLTYIRDILSLAASVGLWSYSRSVLAPLMSVQSL